MADGDSGKMGIKHNPEPSDSDDAGIIAGNLEDVAIEYVEEYDHLSSTIDQLDTCLDALEQKNDNLYTKLQDLLESSRQVRQELEEQRGSPTREHDSKITAERQTQDENQIEETIDHSDQEHSQTDAELKETEDIDQCYKPR